MAVAQPAAHAACRAFESKTKHLDHQTIPDRTISRHACRMRTKTYTSLLFTHLYPLLRRQILMLPSMPCQVDTLERTSSSVLLMPLPPQERLSCLAGPGGGEEELHLGNTTTLITLCTKSGTTVLPFGLADECHCLHMSNVGTSVPGTSPACSGQRPALNCLHIEPD